MEICLSFFFVVLSLLFWVLLTINLKLDVKKKNFYLKCILFLIYCNLLLVVWLLKGEGFIKFFFSIFLFVVLSVFYKTSGFCKECGQPYFRTYLKTRFCSNCGHDFQQVEIL